MIEENVTLKKTRKWNNIKEENMHEEIDRRFEAKKGWTERQEFLVAENSIRWKSKIVRHLVNKYNWKKRFLVSTLYFVVILLQYKIHKTEWNMTPQCRLESVPPIVSVNLLP